MAICRVGNARSHCVHWNLSLRLCTILCFIRDFLVSNFCWEMEIWRKLNSFVLIVALCLPACTCCTWNAAFGAFACEVWGSYCWGRAESLERKLMRLTHKTISNCFTNLLAYFTHILGFGFVWQVCAKVSIGVFPNKHVCFTAHRTGVSALLILDYFFQKLDRYLVLRVVNTMPAKLSPGFECL